MRRLAALLLVAAVPVGAAERHQPRFEPTDLELEDPGVLDLDFQLGPVQSQGPWRLVVPDFEIDLGILNWLELDLDGAWAFEGASPGPGPTFFDHTAPDNLWLSVKIGLLDTHAEDSHNAWALGVQVGPKLPAAPDTSGVGVEGLLLVGRYIDRTHLVLNLGGFIDPAVAGQRPAALEAGLDIDIDLDAAGTFSFSGELAGAAYLSGDPPQGAATAGVTWAARDDLDLSLVLLVGFLDGSDRVGLLFGVSPKLKLW
jgi:hypothetical protein